MGGEFSQLAKECLQKAPVANHYTSWWKTEFFPLQIRKRQGCLFSPLLINRRDENCSPSIICRSFKVSSPLPHDMVHSSKFVDKHLKDCLNQNMIESTNFSQKLIGHFSFFRKHFYLILPFFTPWKYQFHKFPPTLQVLDIWELIGAEHEQPFDHTINILPSLFYII